MYIFGGKNRAQSVGDWQFTTTSVSLQMSLLQCLKAFHSSKENKPSTIFPVCRGLSFKKGSPSIRRSS